MTAATQDRTADDRLGREKSLPEATVGATVAEFLATRPATRRSAPRCWS
ncbi:hypothetical protein [Pseudonocardia thermophila]|nr:hypothetical protein [Pseudonocardia thermophila]